MGNSNINEAITSTDNDVSYVTPEQFGAVGNGVNDDTEALKAMFSAAQTSGQQVVLKSGCTYLISEELEYTVAKANFNGNWATIKVADSVLQTDRINSVIKINILGGTDAKYNMGSFCNLIIDCNLGRATHALHIVNEGKTNYSHIFVKNPAVYGIYSYGGNGASFTYIHGVRSGITEPAVSPLPSDMSKCSTMLYLGCTDTCVSDCEAVDFENGFLTGASGNYFKKCHACCLFNTDVMTYATSFVIWNSVATFTQCTVDSTKYGFKFFNAGRAQITNCSNEYNSTYSENATNLGAPYVLYYETNSNNSNNSTNRGTGTIVTNCRFKSSFTSGSGITCKFDNLGNTGDGLICIDNRPLNLDSVHVMVLGDSGYITPEQFGAVGDGVNDDTKALQDMFLAAQNSGQQAVLKSECTYLITEELEYTVAKANFNGNWATIKVADSVLQTDRINSVIKINILGGTDAKYNMGSFCNLIIDCNLGRATHALHIVNEGKTNYSHIFVKNPAVYGVRSYDGNEASFTYIHGVRSGISEPAVTSVSLNKQPPSDRRMCSTMLFLGCADTYVSDCVAVDFENGFLTGAADNHFNKCHAWCAYNENIMRYATSFVIWGGVATFTQCAVDSTKYGFEFFNAGRALITNCINGYNSVYINNAKDDNAKDDNAKDDNAKDDNAKDDNTEADNTEADNTGADNTKAFGSPYVLYYETDRFKSTCRGTGTVVTNCEFKSPFTSESGITCKFDNLGNTGDGLVSIDYRPLDLDSVHVTALDDLSRMVNGEKGVTPNTNQVSMVKSSKCRYMGHNGIINVHLIIVLNQCSLTNGKAIHITDMPFANAGDKEIVVGVTSKGTLLKATMGNNTTWFSITSLSGENVNFADDEEIHFNLTYKYKE